MCLAAHARHVYCQHGSDTRLPNHISFLQEEIKIANLQIYFEKEICLKLPNAFWERKRHLIELPYINGLDEQAIPTKAIPIQMNQSIMEVCKIEINHLLKNGIIRPSSSPWSYSAFYVNNNAEKERGTPKLVINYKLLNSVLKWIRQPIPNKRDLLKITYRANIYSKFDMKFGFWQIQIGEKDK